MKFIASPYIRCFSWANTGLYPNDVGPGGVSPLKYSIDGFFLPEYLHLIMMWLGHQMQLPFLLNHRSAIKTRAMGDDETL